MSSFQKIEDKERWQELLNKSLFKTFFHSLDWEEFLERNFNWLRFEHYLYKNEAILSFTRYKIFGKERLISHPFCEYGGPLPLKEHIDGMEFKKELFLNFKEPFKISFHPEIPKYFENLGFEEPDSERDTYFIEGFNLKNEEELFKSLRKTTRNEIKKSQVSTPLVEECKNERELKDFHKLHLKSAKKHKTLPYPYSFFKYFLNSQSSKIVLAKYQGKIIAGSIFIFYDKFIHYFLNASDEKYKNLGINHLILWNQMRNYCGKNFQTFDLGGTRRGSNLEIFKRGWGATRYPIFELKNYREKFLKKSKFRNILSILPSFLTKKISSHLLKYKL